jgi:hypothetical protein
VFSFLIHLPDIPTRSASQPEPTSPTSLSHKVTDSTNATLLNGTRNSCEIGTMMSRNMVKSNASSVQPNHAAHQASHWSFVGSFHHGIVPAVVTAVVVAHPWAQAGSYNLASTSSRGPTGYLGYDSFF